jgi:hypothetical protein
MWKIAGAGHHRVAAGSCSLLSESRLIGAMAEVVAENISATAYCADILPTYSTEIKKGLAGEDKAYGKRSNRIGGWRLHADRISLTQTYRVIHAK